MSKLSSRVTNTRHHGKARSKAGKAKLSAAVALGRRGGKLGGPARAKALSGDRKAKIAKHAAIKRWGGKSSYTRQATYSRKPYQGR